MSNMTEYATEIERQKAMHIEQNKRRMKGFGIPALAYGLSKNTKDQKRRKISKIVKKTVEDNEYNPNDDNEINYLGEENDNEVMMNCVNSRSRSSKKVMATRGRSLGNNTPEEHYSTLSMVDRMRRQTKANTKPAENEGNNSNKNQPWSKSIQHEKVPTQTENEGVQVQRKCASEKDNTCETHNSALSMADSMRRQTRANRKQDEQEGNILDNGENQQRSKSVQQEKAPMPTENCIRKTEKRKTLVALGSLSAFVRMKKKSKEKRFAKIQSDRSYIPRRSSQECIRDECIRDEEYFSEDSDEDIDNDVIEELIHYERSLQSLTNTEDIHVETLQTDKNGEDMELGVLQSEENAENLQLRVVQQQQHHEKNGNVITLSGEGDQLCVKMCMNGH